MSALATAAHNVNTSWCKEDIRLEEQSREDGDTYCAVGALAAAIIPQDSMLTLDGYSFGPVEKVFEWERFLDKLSFIDSEEKREEHVAKSEIICFEFKDTYNYIDSSQEGLMLAEVILENYRDRVAAMSFVNAEDIENVLPPSSIIFNFNDHEDTVREDVIAMMEKADVRLDELVALEDKTTDDLVAEIDALLDEPAAV